jgi:hypothetical protein
VQGNPIVDQKFVSTADFNANAKATFVTATSTSGPLMRLLLCAPDHTTEISAVSATSTSSAPATVRSLPGTVFTTPSGAASYNIRMFCEAQNAAPNTAPLVSTVVTHFEPAPAA